MQSLFQFVVAGITVGSIYGLVGVGFSMIFNATGAINFAQGEFVVLGAFISISLTLLGIPVFISLVISALIMFILDLIIERLIIRRVSEEMLSLVIATVGISLILRTVALIFWGREPLSFKHFSARNQFLFME